MAETATKDGTATTAAQEAPPAQLPSVIKMRMPYPTQLGPAVGIDQRQWGVLIDAVWPSAKTVEGVCMAINYCRARNLDPFKKVVHIVPMSVKTRLPNGEEAWREIETVWPGIAEVRITATRTGIYAGKDAAEFGPEVTKTFRHIDDRNDAVRKEREVTFKEWCRVTVYKIVKGVRCAFVGPMVYWEESYATENRFSDVPNEMWASRRSGQLEKCAEAASLRAAFPEELGGEYTAEEMHGRVIEHAPARAVEIPEGQMVPPRPTRSEFDRNEGGDGKDGAKKAGKKKAEAKPRDDKEKPAADNAGGDKAAAETKPNPVVGSEAKKPAETTKPTEPEASDAKKAADKWLAGYVSTLKETADLDDFKKQGRITIESLDGLTEDDRDALRRAFSTVVLTEQRDREKRK